MKWSSGICSRMASNLAMASWGVPDFQYSARLEIIERHGPDYWIVHTQRRIFFACPGTVAVIDVVIVRCELFHRPFGVFRDDEEQPRYSDRSTPWVLAGEARFLEIKLAGFSDPQEAVPLAYCALDRLLGKSSKVERDLSAWRTGHDAGPFDRKVVPCKAYLLAGPESANDGQKLVEARTASPKIEAKAVVFAFSVTNA